MDNGELLAKISQMREAATAVGNSAFRIRDSIDRVDVEIRALGMERFAGTAADDFRAHYDRLTPVLREAWLKLARFQDKLNDAADDIEHAARPTD